MTGGFPGWAHVEAAIRAADFAKLEDYAEVLEGFPAGADPEMGPWICMFAGGPLAALRWALDRGAPADPEVDDGFPPLHAALDAGITFFDHADIYCRGKSEEVFAGIWTESQNLRQKIFVQSKCGFRFEDEPAPGTGQRFDRCPATARGRRSCAC